MPWVVLGSQLVGDRKKRGCLRPAVIIRQQAQLMVTCVLHLMAMVDVGVMVMVPSSVAPG